MESDIARAARLAYGAAYREANAAQISAAKAIWRKKNAAKLKAQNAARYLLDAPANREAAKAYYRENTEARAAYAHANSHKHAGIYRARKAAYARENREQAYATAAAWRAANPDKVRASNLKWIKANPDAVLAITMAYRAQKKRACPPWADREAIKAIYIECARVSQETGIPHEVDHIVPLRGKWVCGLHIPSNLKIILASANRRKSNTFHPAAHSAGPMQEHAPCH